MLYVVALPDPPAGTDFQFVVPGINVYDVVGITAQLDTQGAVSTTVIDASGNGNNGQYVGLPVTLVPGLVSGDTALQAGTDPPVFDRTGVYMPTAPIDLTSDFACSFWLEQDINQRNERPWVTVTDGAGNQCALFTVEPSPQLAFTDATIGQTWAAALPFNYYDGNPHQVGMSYDQATPLPSFYFDGNPVAITANTTVPVVPGPVGDNRFCLFPNVLNASASAIVDELVIFDTQLSAARFAAHYAAGLTGFAAFVAVITADSPWCWYHFDTSASGTGRQPTLVVTNATTELEAIPTGFPAVSTPGPYDYAWQPNLNADSQSQDGTLTTVAIPRLILPGGYTVGTRTLDLQSTDQWSDVNLWWNSNIQDAINFMENYRYPPGVWLRYQKAGATA